MFSFLARDVKTKEKSEERFEFFFFSFRFLFTRVLSKRPQNSILFVFFVHAFVPFFAHK